MNKIVSFLNELISILNEMSPYLMLGFLFAGILYVYFPKHKVNKYLGGNNLKSVINAAVLGVPLPLCSCGVIPTGISFYRNGASKGSSVSFLISTPQTGIDSILVTYSMLGLPFAIIRPIVAFFTGIFGGILTNWAEKPLMNKTDIKSNIVVDEYENKKYHPVIRIFKYAYIDFLSDIAKWLAIGIIIAAAITIIIPDNFFVTEIKNEYLIMIIMLAVSMPLYVCATASVPIAAALMMKGISPGAALVFLMAGPATNAATMLLIGKTLGRKTLAIYLFTIILGAFISGILINSLLPAEWFSHKVMGQHIHHHRFLPEWLSYSTTIILSLLIIYALLKRYVINRIYENRNNINKSQMETKIFIIEGMTCNHCKMSVETNVKQLNGIESAEVNLSSKKLIVKGKQINIDEIKNTIDKLGYEFKGQI